MSGRLIAIEGTDGVGKTTLIDTLCRSLDALGLQTLRLREPGGTELGEEIRGLLKDASRPLCDRSEALLFAAARAQLAEQVVLPALAEGRWVLVDRFLLSSLAYQGVGRGLGVEPVRFLSEFALDGLRADRTLVLQLSPAEAAKRRHKRGALQDRIEAAGLEFMHTVEHAYRQLAADDHSVITIFADGSPTEVAEVALAALSDLI
jgi:dTMP kinase